MKTYPKSIEVRIAKSEIESNPHGSYVNIMLNQKLTEAGMPMIGKLFVHGIRHGTLTFTVDTAANEFVYSWQADPDDAL